MKRINNKKNLYKSIILLVIVVIGIGYAYLTSNLSITGATEVVANTWNIHFENLNVTSGSVTASTPATIDSNNVDITYAITLSRPKDYYEFTVDVKNDGTLPGKVSISTLSGLDTTSSKVIDYSIKYTNGNPVSIGDILNAGAKKKIKVRVYYKDDISATDFPASNLNLTLTYTLQYIQSEEDELTTDNIIQELITNNDTCFTKYEGEVTDQVGETVTASNVFFNKCLDKRNIIFNNMCWQMIRTTENSGIKMVYNGEPNNNGECVYNRDNHKGIVKVEGFSTQSINNSYLYGDSFTYDITNNTFTLINTETATWSDSTYEGLIGKFTCKTTSDTCTTIYQVNNYYSNTDAYLAGYLIDDMHYAEIGNTPFNVHRNSPALVGYMFNKTNSTVANTAPTNGSLMGNDVSYSNGTYTLLPAHGESTLGTTKDNTHHYTCNTTSSTCNKVRYYYYNNYYIELDGEENIDEAVNNMLYNDNVNRYDSSIKGITDAWYAQNLLSKTNMLENIVFCNSRNMTNQSTNGWNKDGSLNDNMNFKNFNSTTDLICLNITDQFSTTNKKAKLTYPVALITEEEIQNLSEPSLIATGAYYWTISPSSFLNDSTQMKFVENGGGISYPTNYNRQGVRPVISLKSATRLSAGDGSETNPWVIE